MLNAITQRAVFERYLTEGEERQLMKHVGRFGDELSRRDAAWMDLLRQTGIRVGSMAGLTVEAGDVALMSRPGSGEPHFRTVIFLDAAMPSPAIRTM